jgi:hypothetical protein
MPRQAGLPDREPCPWRFVDDVGGAFCMAECRANTSIFTRFAIKTIRTFLSENDSF